MSFLHAFFTTVCCRKLLPANHGREKLCEMNVEASLVQPDKPLPGKPLLAGLYNEFWGNILWIRLNCLTAVPEVVISSVLVSEI